MRKEGSYREKIYLFLIRIQLKIWIYPNPQSSNLSKDNDGFFAFESYMYYSSYDAYRLLETVLHY